MKKFIISLLLVITFSFVGLYSICPPGYTAGQNITFTPSGWEGCTITVHWCYIPADPITRTSADIFISEYEIDGDCTILVQYAPGLIPPIPEDFLAGMANTSVEFRTVMGLPPVLNLVTCGDIWQSNPDDYGMQCRLFLGACYQQELPAIPLYEKWVICNPSFWGQCKEYYRYCKRLINNEWVLAVVGYGQPSALFECTAPCTPKCQ